MKVTLTATSTQEIVTCYNVDKSCRLLHVCTLINSMVQSCIQVTMYEIPYTWHILYHIHGIFLKYGILWYLSSLL